MKAIFTELPAFDRYRSDHLTDEQYHKFQLELMKNPLAGSRIQGTGGLRKIRQADPGRGKGKRGGYRVIYYWHENMNQFLLFMIYGKGESEDLTPKEKKMLKQRLEKEKANA